MKERSQAHWMRLFEVNQANVRSTSLGEGVVACTHTISCEERLSVNVETKALQ